MAELSALPPSPPAALSEPRPPVPASSSTLLPQTDLGSDPAPPVPKSSLYANKASTENNHLRQQETTAEAQTAQSSPSPESTPNLYPSVQVTTSPAVTEVSEEQPQIAPLSDAKQGQQEVCQPPVTHEVTQEVTHEVTTQNEGSNEGKHDVTPEVNQEVKPEVATEEKHEESPQTAQEGKHEVTPEATQEATQEREVSEPSANPSAPASSQAERSSPSPNLPSSQAERSSPSPNVPLINEPSGGDPSAAPPAVQPHPAPDTLSYLESASLMSGTLESLSGLGEDGSSVGSDSEINGLAVKRTDKYGFLGGNQYSETGEKEVRVEVSRQREIKWLDMFNHWDKWVKHRFQKVKMRCRKGIPSSLRARAWQLLSNSHELLQANPGKFEELEREQGEPKWLDIIEKDLHRQFPFHEMFAARGGHGQQDLYRILKAYTVYRPDEGYCQAQAPVAAVLLMHMPAEQAFWCLVQICEKYLPGYYSAGLEAIQLDGEIFFSLLRRTCPMAYRHLKKFKIDPILYMTEWFMCIFSRTLPWSCVLRVWDMFFCEGVKIVFRVGLVLLKQMLGSVEKLRELQGMYETMERLRNISPDLIREEVLVQELVTLPVTEALIERECGVQVRKWRESRGELSHQPGRRLHGTRHIYEHKRRASSLASGGSFSFLGSPVPPPGPLRASSSLLSLPGFRRSKNPLHLHPQRGAFSASTPPQSPPAAGGQAAVASTKPPIPPPKAAPVQSPLAASTTTSTTATSTTSTEPKPTQPSTLAPSPKVVSEQITPKIPSPTANNAPLAPAEDKAARRPNKEEKRREKEEERRRQKEKRERDKQDKEKAKKEKERQERERKKSARKKQPGGGGGE